MIDYFIPEHFRYINTNNNMYLWKNYNIYNKINQSGGKLYTEKHTYFDKDGIHTFTMEFNENNETINISIVNKDGLDCVTIYIDKKTKMTILHNMSYYNNCTEEGLKSPGGGSILLRFTINYLIKNKKKYGIKRILLTDNSFFNCKMCSKNIPLSRLRIITHRNTWYGDYGFKPYDVINNKPSIRLLNALANNNKILDTLLTADCDIINIAKDMNNDEKYHKININELTIIISKYKMIRNFIGRLSGEYNKYCCLIRAILAELYETNSDDPNDVSVLTDFYTLSFYLDI